jgi:hypothetical protein
MVLQGCQCGRANGGQDRRQGRLFDVQTLIAIALALGIPLSGLLLPPEDDGTAARYFFTAGDHRYDMRSLMKLVVMPDTDDDSPALNAYRERLLAAASRYLDPGWVKEAARWLREAEPREMRADRAARLRSERNMLLQVAEELEKLADALDQDGDA